MFFLLSPKREYFLRMGWFFIIPKKSIFFADGMKINIQRIKNHSIVFFLQKRNTIKINQHRITIAKEIFTLTGKYRGV